MSKDLTALKEQYDKLGKVIEALEKDRPLELEISEGCIIGPDEEILAEIRVFGEYEGRGLFVEHPCSAEVVTDSEGKTVILFRKK